MIETDRQRRWWFATHPEFSSSGTGQKGNAGESDEDDDSETFTPEDVDAYVDERLERETNKTAIALLESVKSWLGTEFASKSPAEQHALLWDEDEPGTVSDASPTGLIRFPRLPNPVDMARDFANHISRNYPVLMDDPNRTLERAGKALTDAAEITRVAAQIAQGHAYRKHVVEQDEFPEIKSDKQFQRLIERVISNPTEWRPLENGRSAYWDKKTGTVVIHDPTHPDGGTALRPRTGKRFYKKDLQR